jgi:benzoylformate decarboxylase
MAKALGLEALRISDAGELKPKLSSAFNTPGPKLVEVMVDGTL